jgi:hypothetical protein
MPEIRQAQLLLLTRLLQKKLGEYIAAVARTLLTFSPQAEHKKVHKSQIGNPLHRFIAPNVISKPDPETGRYQPFPTYKFTGPLRPVYPLSPRRAVPKHIRLPDYSETGIPRSEQLAGRHKITILDKDGIAAMKKVCKMGRQILDIAAKEVRPGITTDYIDEVVHKATIERDVSHSYRVRWSANPPRHIPLRSTTPTSPNQSAPPSTKSSATAFPINMS